jgi:hypothetical protein
MTESFWILPVILAAAVTLILGIAAPVAWAGGSHHHHKPKLEKFEEADIYFELNNTDRDLGIHGKVDGGPWKKIWLQDSRGRKLMKVTARGRLRKQGVTELFFESAEPTFDELRPEDFFNRFPEGIYKIFGISEDGNLLVGRSLIRHVMPAPPDGIDISGTSINPETVDCDEEAPEVTPEDNGDVVISWAPVDSSHPELGKSGPVEPALYQLVVEIELEMDGKEFTSVYSVDLPPVVTQLTVPADFLAIGYDDEEGGEYKFEILVKDKIGGNQTAIESCFAIAAMADGDDDDGDDDDDDEDE